MKQYRIGALSKNADEYHHNYIEWGKTYDCVANQISDDIDISAAELPKTDEDKRIRNIRYILSNHFKIHKNFEKSHIMMNTRATEKDCERFLNE